MINSKTPTARQKRKTIDFDDETYEKVAELANSKNISFTFTALSLIQAALKEKDRKKSKKSV